MASHSVQWLLHNRKTNRLNYGGICFLTLSVMLLNNKLCLYNKLEKFQNAVWQPITIAAAKNYLELTKMTK